MKQRLITQQNVVTGTPKNCGMLRADRFLIWQEKRRTNKKQNVTSGAFRGPNLGQGLP